MKRPLLLVLGVVLLLGLWVGATYNGLVTARESVSGQWAQVQTQYQRRVDLVPNLVNTVKGAANFEQSTLESVTAARTQWQSAGTRTEQVAAANQMEGALARLLVTVEAYPQLQATQAYRDLMTQLEGTENRIGVARRDYNEAVRLYNVRVQRFPTNLFAAMFGFGTEAFFEAQEGADQAPVVNFE